MALLQVGGYLLVNSNSLSSKLSPQTRGVFIQLSVISFH